MQGFPKVIATKQDVENLITDYPQELILFLQGLLENRKIWQVTSELDDPEEGITDETHMVHTDLAAMGMPEKYFQMEYKNDPNSKIYRMGYTVVEVEALIESID